MIIGLGLAAFSGCGTLQLGYNQGPRLAYWWIDSYVDVHSSQSEPLHSAVRQWFAWHRQHELPAYADWLRGLGAQAAQDITPQQACRHWQTVQDRLQRAAQQGVAPAAELAPTLKPEQIDHLAQQFTKKNDSLAREIGAHEPPRERLARQIKRTVQRHEDFYGPLSEAQQAAIAQMAAQSPFNPAVWQREREARQADILNALRQLTARGTEGPPAARVLERLLAQQGHSPRAEYRQYEERLRQHQCAQVARIHNLATPAQREHLRGRLADYEAQLRELAAQASGS